MGTDKQNQPNIPDGKAGDSQDQKCKEKKSWFERAKYWTADKSAAFSRFFTFRKHYYLEAQQAFRKTESEYNVLKSIIESKQTQTPEEKDTIIEIDKLICEARTQMTYAELWPYIHLIELHLLRLYDLTSLLSYLSIVRNNLYILKVEDKTEWEKKLAEFDTITDTSKIDTEYLRKLLYTITSEINEARRINFMTNDLKHDLMKRFIRITVIIGLFAWLFTYMIVRDPLVHYAIVIGVLGGFFSRILAIQTLEFKPPAFSLLSLYTYTQPLLGGIGALILYLILISPIGPEVISGNTFYLSQEQTAKYFQATITYKPKVFGMPLPMIVTDSTSASIVIHQYPKPGLFLLLAFLAGFSERWLLGTLETIVGKKLQKGDGTTKPTEEGKGKT
ncbi:MAG: hypothetical protein M0P61_13710 [Ignavibacteriaceae bacterium]|nr:hypothetical protein [Ignavibacteriaceae bacterium]